jgi:hypothetical protein
MESTDKVSGLEIKRGKSLGLVARSILIGTLMSGGFLIAAIPEPEERLKLLQLFIGKMSFPTNGKSQIELLAPLALGSEGESGRDLKQLVPLVFFRRLKNSVGEF